MKQGWDRILSSRLFPLLLVGLWAFAYLPYLGTWELIHEEGRRLIPAREMLVTGDYLVPHLHGDVYLNKPPLFFWLTAATATMLGRVDEWAVRLPSALGMLLCCCLLLGFARKQLPRATRALAALFALSCVTLFNKGRLGEIDIVLSAQLLLVLCLWWEGYQRPEGISLGRWVLIGIVLGLAGLTKGPAWIPLIVLPIGCFLLVERRLGMLLSPGLWLCLVLAAAPPLLWGAYLVNTGVIARNELVTLWVGQTGQADLVSLEWWPVTQRIASQVVGNLRDFVLGAMPMGLAFGFLFLREVRIRLLAQPLGRFLLCCIVPSVIFFGFLGRTRHALMIDFPIALLSAMLIVQAVALLADDRFHRSAGFVAWLPVSFGLPALVFLAFWSPTVLPMLAVSATVVLASVAVLPRLVRETPGVLTLSCNVAVFFLVGMHVTRLFLPELIERRPWTAIRRQLPDYEGQGTPIYTAATLQRTLGGVFNRQFYLGATVKSLDAHRPTEAEYHLLLLEADGEKIAQTGTLSAPLWKVKTPCGILMLVEFRPFAANGYDQHVGH